jgi:hypothetical protein
MQLEVVAVMAASALCVSLVAYWYAVRTHQRVTTLKRWEAERDLKLKKLYRERIKTEYPEQVQRTKAEVAARGLAANGQCQKALASLRRGHERELKMVAAEIDYLEKACKG